jgi:DnaK suppressor protein
MNRDMIHEFKELFEEQRRQLLHNRGILNEEFQLSTDDLPDEMDMTSSEMESTMKIRLRNREALFLKRINQALRRIEEGSFGLCDDCGEDIDLRRLQARPITTMCVNCKEESEHRESLHIDGHKPKSLGVRLRLA